MNEIEKNKTLDIGHSKFDAGRFLRTGIPEAIYAPGKTATQCFDLVSLLLAKEDHPVIVTRADKEQIESLMRLNPEAVLGTTLTWRHQKKTYPNSVAIISGGTADQFVGEECKSSLLAMGADAIEYKDVGVAGLQRLLAVVPEISPTSIVIAIAGMEASLPTVLGGLIGNPIIAVPTSTGYGVSFEGVTAALSVLSSCSPGLSIVGIDNGYGAACAAIRLLKNKSYE